MSEVTFGRKALNDPHFVRDIRNGRKVWPATEAKVRLFIEVGAASPALCTTCDHRLDDPTVRACNVRECPNVHREAA
ncbi:hypothetical protein [Sphingobium sp. CECT 9361]|uniref:hypothetical protein n=1 Tax=Sphingobium sp. CECT 9361 TaxID=2845384 RepID=UPI001E62ABB7|nr:hypothetical protein [Sphingobium sp. CECT 9361]